MRISIQALTEKKEELKALYIKDSLLRRQFQKDGSTFKFDPEAHLDGIQDLVESIAILEDLLVEKDTVKSELEKLKKETERRLARLVETPAIQEVRQRDKQRREQLTLESLAREIEEMSLILKLSEHRRFLVDYSLKMDDYKLLEEVHNCYTKMHRHELAKEKKIERDKEEKEQEIVQHETKDRKIRNYTKEELDNKQQMIARHVADREHRNLDGDVLKHFDEAPGCEGVVSLPGFQEHLEAAREELKRGDKKEAKEDN